MAAFNFPASPSNGDTYTLNSVTYQYDGTKWVRYSASVGAQGATGPTGSTGAQGATGSGGATGAQGATGSATLSNNADNRVITGGSGTNLNGESNLTFDGTSMVIGGGSAANVLDLGSATTNKGISWGGASYNYTNIWAEYGSGSLWLGAGLKSKGTVTGFYSSYGSSSFARSAIELESFSGGGIKFFTSGAQTVATDGAITVNERLRIEPGGRVSVIADDGLFIRPGTASPSGGAKIEFSDNSNSSYNQVGTFTYKHSDNTVIASNANANVTTTDAFNLKSNQANLGFLIEADTHIQNDYGLWIKTSTQGGTSGTGGARLRFSSNPSTAWNQIGEISYQHSDDGILTGFLDGFVVSGTDGQNSQQYGAQRTIVKVNGSLQATGNVWGVGSVCQVVRGTDQIVNNQNPPQSPAEISSGFRISIVLRTVNPYIKVTFYANPELDSGSMRSAVYFYYSKNSGSYGTFQRPVWFGSMEDSGNQQGGYSMLGVVGQVTGNRGDTFTFSPYWAEEANSTGNYMFGQTWTQFGNVPMASFMYLEEIATQ